jgi:uncharacterized protein (TIGR04255 family)
VVFARNLLTEVLVDLRFPPILSIETKSPDVFQDGVRSEFSEYSFERAKPPLPRNLPPQLAHLFAGSQMPGKEGGRHIFSSADGKWRVHLLRGILELRTTSYEGWESFRGRLVKVLTAFEATYRPSNYKRIGLRYASVIKRSALGLEGVPWSEILKPWIAGPLAVPDLADNVDFFHDQIHCSLDGDNYFLVLKTGTTAPDTATGERGFLLDCDFHTHKPTEVANVYGTLDEFNRSSGRFFRSSIGPKLYAALGPKPG